MIALHVESHKKKTGRWKRKGGEINVSPSCYNYAGEVVSNSRRFSDAKQIVLSSIRGDWASHGSEKGNDEGTEDRQEDCT